jgi:hypothetical protein
MLSKSVRPGTRELSIAILSLVVVLAGAFITASLNQYVFSLAPPCPKLPCNPTPFWESQRIDLHRTFFTAWAALILVTPALCTFWYRRTSAAAARYWLAFWTISFLAFLVHFYWAVVIMYGADWARIIDKVANGRRVTAPVFDTVFTVWWGIDVLLAWLVGSENGLIRIQRVLVHLSAFALFLLGSAREGEVLGSRALGIAMGVAVLTSVVIWFVYRLKNRNEEGYVPAV